MTVVGDQGKIIGTVSEIMTDTQKGKILNILVNPKEGIELDGIEMENDEQGSFLLPVDQIHAVQDNIVVKSTHDGDYDRLVADLESSKVFMQRLLRNRLFSEVDRDAHPQLGNLEQNGFTSFDT